MGEMQAAGAHRANRHLGLVPGSQRSMRRNRSAVSETACKAEWYAKNQTPSPGCLAGALSDPAQGLSGSSSLSASATAPPIIATVASIPMMTAGASRLLSPASVDARADLAFATDNFWAAPAGAGFAVCARTGETDMLRAAVAASSFIVRIMKPPTMDGRAMRLTAQLPSQPAIVKRLLRSDSRPRTRIVWGATGAVVLPFARHTAVFRISPAVPGIIWPT